MRVLLGVRLDASRTWLGERTGSAPCLASVVGPCGGEIGYQDRTTAGTLSITYTFSGHRVSPYALFGAGAYRLAATETHYYPGSPCPPGAQCIGNPAYSEAFRDASTHFGISGGIGAMVRVWRADLTAEVQYHSYSRRFGGNGHMMPVVFGVRL